ncbi:hypothetical protein VHEMI02743 [[Torrubiella] hemipterigena]|uniref:YMC020W-like alpha/beta hydrolase domain-containing protein n=1 Tax=[Torrubiella] hemipterigena TaxID=1531966 RepID=A0A0A1TBG5_9HYPO|nr:hypothetical protein VHEMI02743 [[Torrubiella] hemipterigena]
MAPRKRQRPNPQVLRSESSAAQSQERSTAADATSTSGQIAANDRQMPFKAPSNGSIRTLPSTLNSPSIRKSQSWYGSWQRPAKATASTSLARENILGDTFRPPAAEIVRFDSKASETASVRSAAGSLAAQSLQPLNGTPDKLVDEPPKLLAESEPEQPKILEEAAAEPSVGTQTLVTETPKAEGVPPSTPQPSNQASGWTGWFSKTPTVAPTTSKSTEAEEPSKPVEETTQPPEPVAPTPAAATTTELPSNPVTIPESTTSRPTSWFGFWPGTPSSAADMKSASEKDQKPDGSSNAPEAEDVVMKDAPEPGAEAVTEETKPLPPPKAGSTWAFWSREAPKAQGDVPPNEAGEIAVIGQGSESHPEPMAENSVSGDASKSKTPAKQNDTQATSKKNKRSRPASIGDSQPGSGTSTPTKEQSKAPATPKDVAKTPTVTSTPKGQNSAESEQASTSRPNLLLPSFTSTYRMKENPSILQQLSAFLLRTSQPPSNHVFKAQETPKIKKAIAIGVHGLMPAAYLRPMIGQPTGTSLRFAGLCSDAIRKWADANGCSGCEIEKVALEGEGRINERVENLWTLLLNWIDHIRKADLVIMACHSQGVPVSIMLLEKLIDLGIITKAKIGVCAMAGVSLGPFPDYKSSLLIGSVPELWDFGNPQSANAQRFEKSLKRVLDYGARITFIGSIDDQVVPMESAVYSPASHPYIYRAVFIDGRVHAPDFIAHLVGFALKLRNLGVSDHGLIRELSVALAGSLYSGEGHSRLYFDSAVYDLAITHTLETTDISQPTPCEIRHHAPSTSVAPGALPLASANPYFLPWTMRGMLEEDFVKTELSSETEELLRQFDDWKPTNKALKDVKYRLEAVRSKL